jgi:hypothetical protein
MIIRTVFKHSITSWNSNGGLITRLKIEWWSEKPLFKKNIFQPGSTIGLADHSTSKVFATS